MMFTFFLCLNVTFLVYSVSKKTKKTSEVIVCSRLRKLFSYFTGRQGSKFLKMCRMAGYVTYWKVQDVPHSQDSLAHEK